MEQRDRPSADRAPCWPTEKPYRISSAALTDLGFTDDEQDCGSPPADRPGFPDRGRAVTPEWLPYFRNPSNALDFVLPGLEDYSTDIFFVLHAWRPSRTRP